MTPSEQVIQQAIENLSAGEFQRLAESYAQIILPNRFKTLDPTGRTRTDATRPGWPDARVLLQGGRVDGVEATKDSDWRGHLERDLKKAENLGAGRLAGFLFVAWAAAPHDPSAVQKYRRRLVRLGVPEANVEFVFQGQLVRDLRQPRFASVWVDPLGLPPSCDPFQQVPHARVFGMPGYGFAPSKEEYLQGLVHRPSVADRVEALLQSEGWALVRGRGATGKTVLAIQIALTPKGISCPAYYLDLASDEIAMNVHQALEVITTLADEGVLFIVDNVHLREDLTLGLFNQWQSFPNRSRFLMLGRQVSTTSELKGIASALYELEPEAVPLEVEKTDLAGVFSRLARRKALHADDVSLPPSETLSQWHRVFAGDLVAFSAAVMRKLDQLLKGRWEIRAEDAREHVQETYLDPLTLEERRNLLLAATLATLEIETPAQALEIGGLPQSVRYGIVQRRERGRARYVSYHLVHPSLAGLLLKAASPAVSQSEMFDTAARRNAFCGTFIAARLEASDRSREAAEVLGAVLHSDGGLAAAVFVPSLQFAASILENMARFGVLTKSEADRQLADEPDELVSSALRTQLHFLASFLAYAEVNLPKVYCALCDALAKPENLKVLSETALRTPVGDLASFLAYAEINLPKVYCALCDALAKPENLKVLSETALRTPVGDLASFLEYAANTLPCVNESLKVELSNSESLRRLAANACRAPLGSFVKFLRAAPMAKAVAGTIDRDTWDKARLAMRSEQPSFLPELSKHLNRFERPELAEAPARALVCGAQIQHWHMRAIGFPHLSHTLRLGRAAGQEAITRFLDSIATEAWLSQQYADASCGAIAGGLYGLWGCFDEPVLRRFRTKALEQRVIIEIKILHALDVPDLSAALQLLGSSALLGVNAGAIRVTWPCEKRIDEVLRFSAARPDLAAIGYIQMQLWIGLREMARLRVDTMRVPKATGNQALALWKKAEPFTERLRTLNTWMINWLEQCKQNRWVLVRDNAPPAKAIRVG
jgi:hypothetical protein